MEHREVEIRPAFEWTCDECGRDNYEKCLIVDLSQEQAAEIMRGIVDIEDDDDMNFTGSFSACPTDVKCRFCKSEFVTKDPE